MRAALALAVSLAFLAVALVPVSGAAGAERERWIVGLHTIGADHRPGQSFHGEPIVALDDGLRFIVVTTTAPHALQERARGDDNVRYLEFDDPTFAQTSLVPNDFYYTNSGHWGSKKIGAEAAWDVTTGSTAVKVAMIDSGLNKAHEEYAGSARVLQGYDFQNGDSDPNDEAGCSYHGTHTTGTAGATINNGKGIAGISQHAILPVKAFYPFAGGCSAGLTPLVNALKYAGDQGAHVSSNSWGSSGSSTALNDAVQYAHGKGTIHVGAAGNSGSCTNCVSYPWRDKAAITIVVSSSTSTDTFSSFSSEGPQVDVIAPGSNILSSYGTGYATMSGTSMATPHVAGVAALLKALHPTWTFTDVETTIRSTADNLGISSDRQGAGRLDAAGAVGAAPPPPAACADGADNDGDGLVDYPADPGCSSASDTDEFNAPPPPAACADGADNDGDGLVDYPADPGCSSATDTDETDTPPPPTISLAATGYKVKGAQKADLTWSGATSANVDVFRNGAKIVTTANDGAHTDPINKKGGGSYLYKVCEAGTTTCSNEATVTF
ncbi:MAG TPA: S8 family serine peptidase [Candidatus Thermoplasmatota archaeon]|nr:S8 family serine peptidase [Candidatus Thermoplasmatota archaeon]